VTSKNQKIIFDAVVSLSTKLRRAGVTIYSIDPLGLRDAGGMRTNDYRQFVKGVTAAKHASPGDLALQVLAYQTGGQVLNSSNDVTGEIAQSVMDANAYYPYPLILSLGTVRMITMRSRSKWTSQALRRAREPDITISRR